MERVLSDDLIDPKSRGGNARAAKLTKEQRREIAKKAAQDRWARIKDPDRLPEAESDGTLQIGAVELDVYLLNDRRRVISKKAMAAALGLKSEGGNAFMRSMSREGIRSGLTPELVQKIENPIYFKGLVGDSADGYEATTLIEVCDALIQARNDERLHPSQHFLAVQAEFIVRSAAKVGIIALVDEAVGYIDRRKDEYRKLFDGFIRDEFRQWEREFPKKFFDMIYRLYGLKRANPDSNRHPQFFGKFIRRYIYFPLAHSRGAILERLDEKNPVVYAGGGRRFKFHQYLTDEIGLDAFRQHLWQTVGIGEASKDKGSFERGFYRAFPEAVPINHQFDMLED